ncbi:hypothetical protein EfmE1679_2440 [Enterococcus faecium E1679]|nr:hypothetical protein EfmE1679_2440 [Enterococcus faecium E1679]
MEGLVGNIFYFGSLFSFPIKNTPRNLNTFLNTIRKPIKMNYHQ